MRISKSKIISYLLLLALATVSVYAENLTRYSEATNRVPFTIKAEAGSITLQQNNVVIVVPQGECSQVRLAAEALQRDFQKVMGFKPAVVNTLGTTDGVELVVVNQTTDGVQALGAQKELEGFESHAVFANAANHRIYLQGADMRGTIYAIYSFSEQVLGVPPLWYWCDIPLPPLGGNRRGAERHTTIAVPDDYDYYQPSPTVRYRAWFPNDEDLFIPWRRKSTDNNGHCDHQRHTEQRGHALQEIRTGIDLAPHGGTEQQLRQLGCLLAAGA